MIVLKAKERSRIDIPVGELLEKGGVLSLDERLIGKGLVEIRQVGRVLKLQINGVVGRLPLTENLSIDVSPKFPVSNLNRMVYSAGSQLKSQFEEARPYAKTKHKELLPFPIVASFCKAMDQVLKAGLQRSYERKTIEGAFKPKIDFGKSQQRYWAKLRPTETVSQQFIFTNSNSANQALKLATLISRSLSRGNDLLNGFQPTLIKSLQRLERVPLVRPVQLIGRRDDIERSCPTSRPELAEALRLAFELIAKTDVSLNVADKGLQLESYLISLDSIFESYIRWVMNPVGETAHRTLTAVDGNRRPHMQPLFSDKRQPPAKPDFIFKDSRGVVMIGDAKYKTSPREEDRYQVISHALAYDVKRAVIVYPKQNDGPTTGLHRLGLVGPQQRGIELYNYFFDLNDDLANQEELLKTTILELCA